MESIVGIIRQFERDCIENGQGGDMAIYLSQPVKKLLMNEIGPLVKKSQKALPYEEMEVAGLFGQLGGVYLIEGVSENIKTLTMKDLEDKSYRNLPAWDPSPFERFAKEIAAVVWCETRRHPFSWTMESMSRHIFKYLNKKIAADKLVAENKALPNKKVGKKNGKH